jgi:HK97 family phage major capsid protein
MATVAQLRQQRATAFDAFHAIALKETLTETERTDYAAAEVVVRGFDDQIVRALADQALAAASAVPVAGQETLPAALENSPYISDAAAQRLAVSRGALAGTARSVVFGGMIQMTAAGSGNLFLARQVAKEIYGENHPVTRALLTSSGASGGFIVPPDYMNDIVELLRALAQVRAAGPRVMPMPRGTMTIPGQASAASATYSGESTAIANSQQTLNQMVASYKKLTALTPVSNDMMRYADPAVDAFVRDDLVKVIALREDLAFIMGDGTAFGPRGWISFANGFATAGGGTAGAWNVGSASTAAVGGNFITSTEAYTQATVANELGGAINRLDSANVPDMKRVWFMHPRVKNYLFNLLNSLGLYVYRDEMKTGLLLGYPFKPTTQIPANIQTPDTTYTIGSFIFLVEMTESLLLDSMSLELAVSREGTYVDGGGNTVSAFQADQTLVRAIAEHDFQVRHDASVAVIQLVLWAPAIQ